jgi:hypothetical protein
MIIGDATPKSTAEIGVQMLSRNEYVLWNVTRVQNNIEVLGMRRLITSDPPMKSHFLVY